MDHTDGSVSPTTTPTTQKENGLRLPEEPPSSKKRVNRVPTSSDDHPSSLDHSPTTTTTATANQSMRASRHKPSVDEITPIFGNGRVNGRNYQSTDHGRVRPTSSDAGEEVFRQRTKSQCDGTCQHHASNGTRHNEADVDDEHCVSWYKNVADKFGSLELENKGSVARDHLALERTFLAWLRTSLAFASIGIAVTQLFRLNKTINHESTPAAALNPLLEHFNIDTASANELLSLSALAEGSSARLGSVGKPLGATFIGLAILVLLVGFHRYFESQYWITRGKFPASRGSVALIAFFAGALIVGSLVVIITIAPGMGAV